MGQGVAGIAVLVQDVGIGDLVLQPPGHTHVRLRGVEASCGGSADNLRAESTQDVHLKHKHTHTHINTCLLNVLTDHNLKRINLLTEHSQV